MSDLIVIVYPAPAASVGSDAVIETEAQNAGASLTMSEFDNGVLLVIEFLCGAAGGVALGRWVRSYSLGRVTDGLIGGLGGLIMVWPATRIPGVGRFVGHVENAADATLRGVGGLTPAILIGAGVVGLLGGVVLMLLAGFVHAAICSDAKPPRH